MLGFGALCSTVTTAAILAPHEALRGFPSGIRATLFLHLRKLAAEMAYLGREVLAALVQNIEDVVCYASTFQ